MIRLLNWLLRRWQLQAFRDRAGRIRVVSRRACVWELYGPECRVEFQPGGEGDRTAESCARRFDGGPR